MSRHLTNVLLGTAVAGALVTGTAAFGTGSPGWGWALAVAHGGRPVEAVLDCTGGWYANTIWEGVALSC